MMRWPRRLAVSNGQFLTPGMLIVLGTALVGCTGDSNLSSARVTIVEARALAGTVRSGDPPPWTLVLIDETDRRLPMRLDEGGYSDCPDQGVGRASRGCPFTPARGKLKIESLGFAGIPTAQLSSMAVGATHRQSVERFSARSAASVYDTIAIDDVQPTPVEWKILAQCTGRIVSVEGSAYKDGGSGVIGVPRSRPVRWTELRAPCVPPG